MDLDTQYHQRRSYAQHHHTSPTSPLYYLSVSLDPAPRSLQAVREVIPTAQCLPLPRSAGNFRAEGDDMARRKAEEQEAVARTKAALLTLRAAWASGSAEWEALDACFELHGFPTDPLRSAHPSAATALQFASPAASLDVLHGHLGRLATHAVLVAHRGVDALALCIEAVRTFALAQAHRDMSERLAEEWARVKEGVRGRAARRREAEMALGALLDMEVGVTEPAHETVHIAEAAQQPVAMSKHHRSRSVPAANPRPAEPATQNAPTLREKGPLSAPVETIPHLTIEAPSPPTKDVAIVPLASAHESPARLRKLATGSRPVSAYTVPEAAERALQPPREGKRRASEPKVKLVTEGPSPATGEKVHVYRQDLNASQQAHGPPVHLSSGDSVRHSAQFFFHEDDQALAGSASPGQESISEQYPTLITTFAKQTLDSEIEGQSSDDQTPLTPSPPTPLRGLVSGDMRAGEKERIDARAERERQRIYGKDDVIETKAPVGATPKEAAHPSAEQTVPSLSPKRSFASFQEAFLSIRNSFSSGVPARTSSLAPRGRSQEAVGAEARSARSSSVTSSQSGSSSNESDASDRRRERAVSSPPLARTSSAKNASADIALEGTSAENGAGKVAKVDVGQQPSSSTPASAFREALGRFRATSNAGSETASPSVASTKSLPDAPEPAVTSKGPLKETTIKESDPPAPSPVLDSSDKATVNSRLKPVDPSDWKRWSTMATTASPPPGAIGVFSAAKVPPLPPNIASDGEKGFRSKEVREAFERARAEIETRLLGGGQGVNQLPPATPKISSASKASNSEAPSPGTSRTKKTSPSNSNIVISAASSPLADQAELTASKRHSLAPPPSPSSPVVVPQVVAAAPAVQLRPNPPSAAALNPVLRKSFLSTASTHMIAPSDDGLHDSVMARAGIAAAMANHAVTTNFLEPPPRVDSREASAARASHERRKSVASSHRRSVASTASGKRQSELEVAEKRGLEEARRRIAEVEAQAQAHRRRRRPSLGSDAVATKRRGSKPKVEFREDLDQLRKRSRSREVPVPLSEEDSQGLANDEASSLTASTPTVTSASAEDEIETSNSELEVPRLAESRSESRRRRQSSHRSRSRSAKRSSKGSAHPSEERSTSKRRTLQSQERRSTKSSTYPGEATVAQRRSIGGASLGSSSRSSKSGSLKSEKTSVEVATAAALADNASSATAAQTLLLAQIISNQQQEMASLREKQREQELSLLQGRQRRGSKSTSSHSRRHGSAVRNGIEDENVSSVAVDEASLLQDEAARRENTEEREFRRAVMLAQHRQEQKRLLEKERLEQVRAERQAAAAAILEAQRAKEEEERRQKELGLQRQQLQFQQQLQAAAATPQLIMTPYGLLPVHQFGGAALGGSPVGQLMSGMSPVGMTNFAGVTPPIVTVPGMTSYTPAVPQLTSAPAQEVFTPNSSLSRIQKKPLPATPAMSSRAQRKGHSPDVETESAATSMSDSELDMAESMEIAARRGRSKSEPNALAPKNAKVSGMTTSASAPRPQASHHTSQSRRRESSRPPQASSSKRIPAQIIVRNVRARDGSPSSFSEGPRRRPPRVRSSSVSSGSRVTTPRSVRRSRSEPRLPMSYVDKPLPPPPAPLSRLRPFLRGGFGSGFFTLSRPKANPAAQDMQSVQESVDAVSPNLPQTVAPAPQQANVKTMQSHQSARSNHFDTAFNTMATVATSVPGAPLSPVSEETDVIPKRQSSLSSGRMMSLIHHPQLYDYELHQGEADPEARADAYARYSGSSGHPHGHYAAVDGDDFGGDGYEERGRSMAPRPYGRCDEVQHHATAGHGHKRRSKRPKHEPPPRVASLSHYRTDELVAPAVQAPVAQSNPSGGGSHTTVTYMMSDDEDRRMRMLSEAHAAYKGLVKPGYEPAGPEFDLTPLDDRPTPTAPDDGIEVGMDAITFVEAKRRREAEEVLLSLSKAAREEEERRMSTQHLPPGRRSISQPPPAALRPTRPMWASGSGGRRYGNVGESFGYGGYNNTWQQQQDGGHGGYSNAMGQEGWTGYNDGAGADGWGHPTLSSRLPPSMPVKRASQVIQPAPFGLKTGWLTKTFMRREEDRR
ncbi:hypothetical protein HDU96_002349 [Phlyctochytrium bullatum]|nr:hypothetical protein HDU96_002349 [Phlyctochytrium bullatum]